TDFKVTLVGAPNAGKTTLFNWLTGSRYRTVNYPGATVEYSKGVSLDVYGSQFQVLDTPGLYSLHTSSLEEKVTFDLLFKNANPADILIVVVDATQLSRHLYLVRQLTSTGYKVVVALTMTDLLKK